MTNSGPGGRRTEVRSGASNDHLAEDVSREACCRDTRWGGTRDMEFELLISLNEQGDGDGRQKRRVDQCSDETLRHPAHRQLKGSLVLVLHLRGSGQERLKSNGVGVQLRPHTHYAIDLLYHKKKKTIGHIRYLSRIFLCLARYNAKNMPIRVY